MRNRALAVVSTTALLAIVGLAMAMVVPGAVTAAPRLPKIDLSTDAAVHSYLRSIGVDPSTVVIQRGLNNYAGPNCPGLGWNCTTSTRAVQVAAAGGQNKFTCDPAFFENGDPPFPLPPGFGETDATTNMCVIVQDSIAAQNHARCFIHSSANPATLTCKVAQQNVSGDNHFQGHQRIRQTSGANQAGHIDLDLYQWNVVGSNHAHSLMQIFQSTSDVNSGEQDQNGTFDASPWHQQSEAGNNFGHLSQALNQDGRAKGGSSVVQRQFGNHVGDVDQFAEPAGEGIAQVTSGQGFSKFTASQSEVQTLTGSGEQTQEGPQRCCGVGTQTGDPAQTSINIDQRSTQRASQFGKGLVSQSQDVRGDCNTTGLCTIHHNVTNEAGSANRQESGTGVVTLHTTCFAFSGEGEGGACTDEGA